MEEAGVSDLMAFMTRRSSRGTWIVNKRRAGTASAMFVLFLPSCYRFEGTRSIPTIFDSIRDECLCLGFPSRPLRSFRIGEDNEQPLCFFFQPTGTPASTAGGGRTLLIPLETVTRNRERSRCLFDTMAQRKGRTALWITCDCPA